MLKSLINKYKFERDQSRFRMEWRDRNKHNYTIAVREFPIDQVTVGKKTYGELNILLYDNCSVNLQIGAFCSIAKDVVFLIGGEHDYRRIMTYPIEKYVLNQDNADGMPVQDTIIEDDVWIGYGAKILSGVHIGKGAIVAAGTTVAKDIPPYAIFANGRIIKYRFSKETIEELLTIDLTKIPEKVMMEYPALFMDSIDLDGITKLKEMLDKL